MGVTPRGQGFGSFPAIRGDSPVPLGAPHSDTYPAISGSGFVTIRLMDELEAEIAGQPWIYPWRLRDGRQVPLAVAELETLQRSVTGMMEPRVRAALDRANASALDLACCEGWFSHRLLDWGASRVVGIEVRENNIRRAKLLREHFGIPDGKARISVQGDVLDIDPDALGTFDVVLVLGLIYHVENPMGLLVPDSIMHAWALRRRVAAHSADGRQSSTATAARRRCTKPKAASRSSLNPVGTRSHRPEKWLSLIPNRSGPCSDGLRGWLRSMLEFGDRAKRTTGSTKEGIEKK